MKFLKFSIAFFLVCQTILAQQEVNTSFKDEMNTIFQHLDKDRVPHGILLDFGMEFTNLNAFNGNLTDSTYVDKIVLKEMYKTLLTSRIVDVREGFVLPDDFDTNWHTARNKDEIVLSGLFFNYSKLSDDAYPQKLKIEDDKLYDLYIDGRWQNPYEDKKTFAITTPIIRYEGLNLNVKLPSNLFYSNNISQIRYIEIDMDDNQGYRTLPFDNQISASYQMPGNKIWKYKVVLVDGSVLESHSKIKISKAVNTTPIFTIGGGSNSGSNFECNDDGRYSFELTASEAYLGQNASVTVTFDDAGGDCKITKPLIVAEGFDVGTLLSPENEFGDNNITLFQQSISNDTDLKNLIHGNDQEYDIIYVDWNNGVDYLQRNALALQAVIEWVNDNKVGNEENIVLGQSMGGVIARYALSKMENDNIPHDTKLFVSHDAPQQGANVPLGFQYMYRHLTNQYITASETLFGGSILVPLLEDEFSVSTYLSILDTPASRQLLKVWSDLGYEVDNGIHDSFYQELRGLNDNNGYPSQNGIRNIAISNGSECGTTLDFNAGDPLFHLNYDKSLSFWGDMLSLIFNPLGGIIGGLFLDPSFFGVGFLGMIPGNSQYIVEFEANSLNDLSTTSNHRAYRGLIRYKKKIAWVFNSQVTITDVNKNQPTSVDLPLDYYGGGFFEAGNALDLSEINNISSSMDIFVEDNFSFIQTTSALDIGGGDIPLSNTDYRNSYVGANPPTGSQASPFNNFATAFSNPDSNNNERHLEFNRRNGDWLADELQAQNPADYPIINDCSHVCDIINGTSNNNISGSSSFCTSADFTITNFDPAQWSDVAWEVSPSSAGSINLVDSHTMSLTKSGHFNGPATITAKLDAENCGKIDITRNIYIWADLYHKIM